MVVDIVDAVAYSSMHAPIIPNVQLFVNILIASRKAAPFILPHKGVGFQGQGSINQKCHVHRAGIYSANVGKNNDIQPPILVAISI
jgi:hypothetical protein